MTGPLVDVSRVQEDRLRRASKSTEVVAPLTELLSDMGMSPVAAMSGLARDGNWGRCARSAARRKEVLRRGFGRQVTLASEDIEANIHIARQLQAGRPFTGSSTDLLKRVEAALGARGVDQRFARKALQAPPVSLDHNVRIAAETVRKAWTAAIRRDAELNLVRAVAEFNAQSGTPFETAGDVCEATRRFVRDCIQELADRLTRGHLPLAASAASARVLAGSHLLATQVIPALAAHGSASPTDLDQVERAVELADSARDLLWLVAALKVVAWRCTWPETGEAHELVAAATELPLRAKSAKVPRLTLRQAGGDSKAPEQVELLGVVQELTIKHELRGKPYTVLSVRMPDGQAGLLVQARVEGFKADSTGCVPGAAVALVGTWKQGDPTSPDSGRLRVGRAQLVGDRKSSFEAHLRWATSTTFWPVPHALFIRSGWVQGLDGPLNPFRYGVTARTGKE